MSTFRKPLPSMAGYVRRHHSLACVVPKTQTKSRAKSSAWPELGCDWPIWYKRQGVAGGERKLFILTRSGFLSQAHMSLLLLKSTQTVPGQRLLLPHAPALEMGRGGWPWSLLGAAPGLCRKPRQAGTQLPPFSPYPVWSPAASLEHSGLRGK